MLFRLALFICLWSFFAASQSQAATMNFYGASVLVQSQSSVERKRATEEGLKQVLVRVSGETKVVSSPKIIEVLSNASKYLDQYHYQLDRLEDGDKQEQLVMSFAPTHVRRILANASEPIWPTNRPKVLLWLVQDHSETGKTFVNVVETPVTLGLQQGSLSRGLPITFPLLDLDDQLALSAEQVWTLDEDAIVSASERYQVDTILVGRYTETSQGQWWGTWQFFHRGKNSVYDMRTETGEEQGLQAVEPVADYLARLYSVTTSAESESQLYVNVSQVEGFGAYKGLLNYLEQLAVVPTFNVVSVDKETVLLGLQLAGSLGQLENAISLDDKIRVSPVEPMVEPSWLSVPEGTLEQPLKFVWVGQ